MKKIVLCLLFAAAAMPLLRLEGVLQAGVECPLLVTEDAHYSLAGQLEGVAVGDTVKVIGKPAEASFCMQGTTLEVLHIKPL
jgi:hypothetical protein